jgi:general secretion pathway protein G
MQRRERPLPGFLTPGRPSSILLALIILAVVGGVLVGRSTFQARVTPLDRRRTADDELWALGVALEQFRADCGRYPRETEGLNALVRDPGIAGWDGNYVTLVRADPWARPYCYRLHGTNVVLFSCGPDRTEGTDDDIRAEHPAGGGADSP